MNAIAGFSFIRWFVRLLPGIFILSCAAPHNGFGQNVNPQSPTFNTVVQREIDCFSLLNAGKADPAIRLKEIPLLYAHDSRIYLEKGNWYGIHRSIDIFIEDFDASKDTLVYGADSLLAQIDGKAVWGVSDHLPQRKVKGINIFHVKYGHGLPDSAFAGIFEPPIYRCNRKECRKRKQAHFKAYFSEDYSRMYIYMLNGTGKDRYEVIWLVYGMDYYNRYIRKVPE